MKERFPSSGCTYWKGWEIMTNPAVMSTPKYPCVLQTLFLTKMNQVFLGEKFIPGLRQEMYKMSLEHTVTLESKETIKDNQYCVKRTQQPVEQVPNQWSKTRPFEHQWGWWLYCETHQIYLNPWVHSNAFKKWWWLARTLWKNLILKTGE